MSDAPAPSGSLFARGKAFLRRHPILCLALLTPGIPEYLSGSSSPIGLLLNPFVFGLFLLANLGLYTAGVLLIREARVRWRIGWAGVLALGIAYGIAEEGLALDTLYNLHAGPVNPATAGHLVGVNWIWASQILPFHALYSVALPLLLLDLALPETRNLPLLSPRGIRWTAAAYLTTIGALGVGIAATTYWMGWPVLFGSLATIGGLVLLSRALPADALGISPGAVAWGSRPMFLLGVSFFPAMFILPLVLGSLGAPLVLVAELGPGLAVLWAVLLLRGIRTDQALTGLLSFAGGLLLPVMAFGFFFALRFPPGLLLVGAVDLLAGGFLWGLYRRALATTPAPGPRAAITAA